jgi:hypothetical protein
VVLFANADVLALFGLMISRRPPSRRQVCSLPMPSDRKPSLILPVAVAAVVLLSGYVGAYYALVSRGRLQIPVVPNWKGSDYFEERYEFGDRFCRKLFLPIHWLDRQVRRDSWRLE